MAEGIVGAADNIGSCGCWKDPRYLPIVEHGFDEPQIAELAESFAYYSCYASDSWSAILHGSTRLVRQGWLGLAAGVPFYYDMSHFDR